MAAQAVGRTQSPLGLFYRRIKSRIGGQGAVTVTAHELARLGYRVLKFGAEYVKQSMAGDEAELRGKLGRQGRGEAAKMGVGLGARGAGGAGCGGDTGR